MLKQPKNNLIIGLTYMILGILMLFLINHGKILSVITILFIFISIFMTQKHRQRNPTMIFILTISLVLSVINLIFNYWIVQNTLGGLLFIWGLILSVSALIKPKHHWLIRLFSGIITIGLIFLGSILLFITFNPTSFVNHLRDVAFPVQNVKGIKQTKATFKNGTKVTYNIQYDKKYPNGFLDVYHSSVSQNLKKKSTVIFIHGGGYVWGDKQSGDPNTGNGIAR